MVVVVKESVVFAAGFWCIGRQGAKRKPITWIFGTDNPPHSADLPIWTPHDNNLEQHSDQGKYLNRSITLSPSGDEQCVEDLEESAHACGGSSFKNHEIFNDAERPRDNLPPPDKDERARRTRSGTSGVNVLAIDRQISHGSSAHLLQCWVSTLTHSAVSPSNHLRSQLQFLYQLKV